MSEWLEDNFIGSLGFVGLDLPVGQLIRIIDLLLHLANKN